MQQRTYFLICFLGFAFTNTEHWLAFWNCFTQKKAINQVWLCYYKLSCCKLVRFLWAFKRTLKLRFFIWLGNIKTNLIISKHKQLLTICINKFKKERSQLDLQKSSTKFRKFFYNYFIVIRIKNQLVCIAFWQTQT